MSEIIATNGGDIKARHTVVLDSRVSSPASRRSCPAQVRHPQHTHAFLSITHHRAANRRRLASPAPSQTTLVEGAC